MFEFGASHNEQMVERRRDQIGPLDMVVPTEDSSTSGCLVRRPESHLTPIAVGFEAKMNTFQR